jgi:hypothetical protein
LRSGLIVVSDSAIAASNFIVATDNFAIATNNFVIASIAINLIWRVEKGIIEVDQNIPKRSLIQEYKVWFAFNIGAVEGLVFLCMVRSPLLGDSLISPSIVVGANGFAITSLSCERLNGKVKWSGEYIMCASV